MANQDLSFDKELQNSFGFENITNIQIPETNDTQKKKIEINLHSNQINKEEVLENNVKAKYPYLDENGQIKYRIIRFLKPNSDGNLFAVESKGSDGQMVSGMNETKKIPYNLPNVIQANGNVVYIVNGEDKVEALKSLGIIATTAPFSSAKKWDKKFNKYLSQAGYIIILADNKQDSKYIKYLDNTLETVREDYSNVARVEIADYFDFFNVDNEKIKNIIDLIKTVPKEQISDFFNSINNKVLELIEV